MNYSRLLILASMLALTAAVSAQQATPPSTAPAQPDRQAANQPLTLQQQAQSPATASSGNSTPSARRWGRWPPASRWR